LALAGYKQCVTRAQVRALFAIALAAVAIRLAVSSSFKGHRYVVTDPVRPEPEAAYLKRGEIGLGDSEQYLLLGQGIRHRLSYSWNHEPNTFRTPGYPLLLAFLDNNVTAVVVVQAFLAGLTVLLAGLVGSRLLYPRAGLLGAALLAVDIPSIFLAGMVMSEVLFTFAVVLAAFLVWGSGEATARDAKSGKEGRLRGGGTAPRGSMLRAAFAGLVLGFAVLVRPVAVLAVAPFGFTLTAGRNWRGLGVMLAAFALLPGVWVARNYHHYRELSLTSNGAYNLLYANAAALQGDQRHVSWDSTRVELARDYASKLATDNPLVLADSMTRKAMRVILRDPLRYAWVCLRAVPNVVFGIKADDLVLRMGAAEVSGREGSMLLNRGYGASGERFVIWLLAGFELLTAIGAFLLALLSPAFGRRRAGKLLLVFTGLCFVVVALPFADGRFRVPAMPFLYLAAAALLAGGARREGSP